MLQFDEEASRRVMEAYTTPDVVAQRQVTLEALKLAQGERVLDVGSGPGMLAVEMAQAVGPGGAVHGIDVSDSMLEIARRQKVPEGTAPMAFENAEAGALPFEDDSFDAAVSTQVYEYVPDIAGALAEVHRVLRPGGRLLILDTHWDSLVWHSPDPERMHRVLLAWEDHLAHVDLPQRLNGFLHDGGFAVRDRFAWTLLNAGWDEDAFSARLIPTVAAYVPGHGGVTEEEADGWAQELRSLGRDYFFSLTRYVFLAVANAS
jgi:SAM-dependent methyltransferase